MSVRTLPGRNLATDNTDWVEKSVESAMKDYFREGRRSRRFLPKCRVAELVFGSTGVFFHAVKSLEYRAGGRRCVLYLQLQGNTVHPHLQF